VAKAASKTVAVAAPGAVVAAARIAVAEAADAALAKAAFDTVAEKAPAAVADAVSAAVTNAVPAAVAEAVQRAVAEAVAAAVAKAASAAVAAAAAAAVAAITPGAVPVSIPPGERSPQLTAPEARLPLPSLAPPSEAALPMSSHAIHAETDAPRPPVETPSGLERLLHAAVARRASTLYLLSNTRPSVCVDGQLQPIDDEPVPTPNEVVSQLQTLMPNRDYEALRTGVTTEWTRDLQGVGRVRCTSFSDHRGPGAVFRMPARNFTADQLGLPPEIRLLTMERAGLVLVVGPRSSGKRTLMSALVDLINRTVKAYVISIEHEVNAVYGPGNSIISQREIRGHDDDVLAAARAALSENPDVLVLEEIRTGTLMNVAFEGAASGHLVIAGFCARDATESINQIVNFYAPEHARLIRSALAAHLRGVVAQVLLADVRGGRLAAREILLNTPAVAGLIAEGNTAELSGTNGMVPLHEALAAHVQNGVVDIGEAYRHAVDGSAFTALLKRRGIDTSAVERFV
jgi:twitching motility protein PilT